MMISESESIRRKEFIVDTAFRLFCKKGIDSITISFIAKESNVSELSIYRYFHKKSELLFYTHKQLWIKIADKLIKIIASSDNYDEKNGYEQLKVLLWGFKQLYENHSEYLLFAAECKLYLFRHSVKMTQDDWNEMLKQTYNVFCNAIDKGKNDKSIINKQSTNDLFYSIWGIMRGFIEEIVLYEHIYEGNNPWKDRFDDVCDMVLSTLKKKESVEIAEKC